MTDERESDEARNEARGADRRARCAGLLLTGGRSRRLGTDKATLRLDGESLAHRSARLLVEVATPVLEVGPGFSGLDAVLEDPPGAGPLAGVVAGAAALGVRGAAHLPALVVAVDLPRIDRAVLELLASNESPGADAVVPRVAGRAQPLCARYSARALAVAGDTYAAGARSMREWLEALTVRWLDERDWAGVADAGVFEDVDTPADVRRVGLEMPG